MTIKRKGGRVRIEGRNVPEDTREALYEIMGNLPPEAQLQRMRTRLEQARAAGLPDSLYATIKGELDNGYTDVAKDSLLKWRPPRVGLHKERDAEIIRRYRSNERRKWTQEALAEKYNLSVRQISTIIKKSQQS